MKDFRLGVLLHFFQPYWQFPHMLQKIVEQCYRPIFHFVRNYSQGFAFTANINYSLLELLKKHGYDDVLDDIKYCVENNLIELMGTVAYHPIIPLIPIKCAGMQIAEDFCKKKFMGLEANSKGFFFPEMAFSKKSLHLLHKLGFNWTVIEDVAVLPDKIPFDHIFSYHGYSVFLRSSHWSKYVWDEHVSFGEFSKRIGREFFKWTDGAPSYLVIAMDAETFGHHVPGLSESFLFPLIKNWGGGKVVSKFEELLKMYPHRENSEIRDCSWSTSYDDLYRNDPFPLWKSKYNGHQLILWDLVYMALKYWNKQDAIHPCLKMVNSCHWWWISRGMDRGFWNPHFMLIGAKKALAVIEKCGTREEKIKARWHFEILEQLCH